MASHRFGDVLRELLEKKLGERQATRLATVLRVDPSLVRRWLRNERVPSLDSHYLVRIGEVLNLTDEEFERLRQAQITTLSDPSLRPSAGKNSAQQIRRLLQFQSQRAPAPSTPPGRKPHLNDIYRGHGAMVRAFRDAVDWLPPAPPEHEVLVSLTSRFRGPRSENDPRLDAEWVESVLLVIQKGWDFTFLTRAETPEESQNIAQRIIEIVNAGPGRYISYVFDNDEPPRGQTDVIIFPDFALVGLRPLSGIGIESVMVVRAREHVQLLREHFQTLRAGAQPGIAVYSPDDVELVAGIAEAEADAGGRLVVKDGFSVTTTPLEWLTSDKLWSEEHPMTRGDFRRLIEVNRQRVEEFEQQVLYERWLDFSSKMAVEELANNGLFRSPDLAQSVILEPEDRVHFLRHLIDLLERFPNYQLALAGHQEMHLFSPAGWMVKGRQHVVLRRRLDDVRYTSVIVHNSMVAEAFRDYFTGELWEAILPRHRDRSWVIDFLRQKIAAIERR